MSNSEDISNLFRKFGGQADSYQEIVRDDQAKESQARWPLLSAVRLNEGTAAPAVKVHEHLHGTPWQLAPGSPVPSSSPLAGPFSRATPMPEPSAGPAAAKPGIFSAAPDIPAADTASPATPTVSGWRRVFGARAGGAQPSAGPGAATGNAGQGQRAVPNIGTVEGVGSEGGVEPTATQALEDTAPSAQDGGFGTPFPGLSEPAFGPTRDLPLEGLASSLNEELSRAPAPPRQGAAPMPSASLLAGLFPPSAKADTDAVDFRSGSSAGARRMPAAQAPLPPLKAASAAPSSAPPPRRDPAWGNTRPTTQPPAPPPAMRAGTWPSLSSAVGERKAAASPPGSGSQDSLSAIFRRLAHEGHSAPAPGGKPASSLLRRLKSL